MTSSNYASDMTADALSGLPEWGNCPGDAL